MIESAKALLPVLLLGLVVSWSCPAMAAVKVIPVPAFSTAKNEGETYGQLTAILFTGEDGQVKAIMAPFVVYNQIIGVKSAWQLFGYMPGDRDFVIKASYSTRINREYRFEYRDPSWLGGRFALEAKLLYFKEATARFYGLTESSHEEHETNYTHREFSASLLFGLNLPHAMRISLVERFREVELQLGGVDELPFISDRFSQLNGLDGATIVAHRLVWHYDSRDDLTTPTIGRFLSVFGEWAHVLRYGGAVPFARYGGQAKGWFPYFDRRWIFVPNLRLEWVNGSDVPFYERSALGGQDTLRAFGLGRFVDDNFVLVNLELRTRAIEFTLLGVRAEGELAPFIDMGRVFSSMGDRFFTHWQVNPGLGMRLLVRPNVVGRFDVGVGREGPAFFVGLDFPF